MDSLVLKTLIVGETQTGKSSLMFRYSDKIFREEILSTIGVDFKIVSLNINNVNVRMQIWDTSGNTRFRTVTTAYFRGASCILLVYAVNNRQSFEAVERHYQMARTHNESAVYILVGTKSDLPDRTVTEEQAREWATAREIMFFETSAKQDIGIENLMTNAAQEGIKKMAVVMRDRPLVEPIQRNRWRGPAVENLQRQDFNRKQHKVEGLEFYAPVAILFLLLALVAIGII